MSDLSKEVIAELLLGNAADALISSYIHLSGILTEAGYTSHHDQLDELYSQYNALNIDQLELTGQVDAILLNSLDVVLDMCGVKLNPDLDIDLRCTIAEGILAFDITEYADLIYRKLDNAEDDVTGLVKVLNLTISVDVDDLYPAIESVEPALMQKIREMLIAGIAPPTPVFSDEQETASDIVDKRYRLIKTLKPDTLGGQLAEDVDPSDVTFESLYAYNARVLMKKEMNHVVDDLYSLAALGGLSLEAAKTEIGLALDDLYPTVLERAKATRTLLSLESEYEAVFAVEVNHEEV